MLNPPAEYSAAKANPITVALITAITAATASDISGISSKGHNGGRVLLCPLSLGGPSGGLGLGKDPG
jgi:hypothetical protein